MRSSKQRSRSKPNRPRTLGNIVNRVFDSSGPEGKVRGTPQQIIEKYQVLARDAQLSNDRVAYENFLQHSEHYTRMLGEAAREMQREADERRDQNGQPRQNGDGSYDGLPRDDRDDDGDSDMYVEQPRPQQQQQPRPQNQPRPQYQQDRQPDRSQPDRSQPDRSQQDRSQQDRSQQDRQQQDRQQQDRNQQDRQQRDRQQQDRPQGERSPQDRPQQDRTQQDRPPQDRAQQDRAPQPRQSYSPVVSPVAAVIDLLEDRDSDTGLVDTPEMAPENKQLAKPARKRTPRKPKADDPTGDQLVQTESSDKAAE